MGQFAAQLFHGQVCVIPSLSNLQGADKRSRLHFKCAICIWNLLLSTLNMRSKELSLSEKQALKKNPFTTVVIRSDQEHSPGGRCMCVKVNNQEKTSPE